MNDIAHTKKSNGKNRLNAIKIDVIKVCDGSLYSLSLGFTTLVHVSYKRPKTCSLNEI